MEQKKTFFERPVTVSLLAMFCCFLWGTAFPGVKIGYRLFQISSDAFGSQLLFAGCRFTLAGMMVILFGSLVSRSLLRPRKGTGRRILILALFQTFLQYTFFYIGLAHASGVKASIIVGSNVFTAILFASLLFRQEKLTGNKLLGCLLGVSGIVLVNLNGTDWGTPMHVTGEGFILMSSLSYAVSSVLVKRYSAEDDPVMLSGYQFLCGGVALVIVGLLSGGSFTQVTPQSMGVLFYLSFLSALAYSIWGILLKHNPVSKVAIWGFTNPILGVVFSMLLLPGEHQVLGLQIFVALLLVSLGIYIVNRGMHMNRQI